MIDFNALKAPFPADAVSWRVGSQTKDKSRGMALAYIDARDVMNRLDEVCGPAGWQCRYPHAGAKTVCDIGIHVGDGLWIWKADGAGDSDIEAEKGSLSDAFKRAAVRWGIGRYLYELDSPWVALDNNRIADSEIPKLRALLVKGGAAKAEAPKPAPAKPPSTGGWPYVASDGTITRYQLAMEWFNRLQDDAGSKPAKAAQLWAVNGTVAQDIVNSVPSDKRARAQAMYDDTTRLIDELTIPLGAGD